MRGAIPLRITGLAGVAQALGKPELAARLLGAAEAQLEAVGEQLNEADYMEYDRIVAAVRAQLDEATFAAAWAAGRALTEEQAIEEAIGRKL